MNLKSMLRKLYLKVSPTFRKVDKMSTQLDEIHSRFAISNGKVYIDDYSKYNPHKRESLRHSRIGAIMDKWWIINKNEAIELVSKFCTYKQYYEKIPFDTLAEGTPKWNNDFLPSLDAISIYGFLADKNPRYYVEVGSGNTTLFAAQSIRDNNLRTKIISIDPFPRADVDKLCFKVYRMPFEDMDLEFFATLSAEDIFLVDNSHRSFPNSDVTVFFTEVLPMLPSGILFAMHDICPPNDYSEEWSNHQRRWYNEQYLLCAYLLGGAAGDKIIFPTNFMLSKSELIGVCDSLCGKGEMLERKGLGGSLFWMAKA